MTLRTAAEVAVAHDKLMMLANGEIDFGPAAQMMGDTLILVADALWWALNQPESKLAGLLEAIDAKLRVEGKTVIPGQEALN